MVDTATIIFTDHDGNAVNLFCSKVTIQYVFPLSVEHKNGMVGYTTDPLRQYRVVTATAQLSGDTLNTLNGYLMDTAKSYDATDPKIQVYLDGDTSLTILVAVMDVTADIIPSVDGQWMVTFRFEQRTT